MACPGPSAEAAMPSLIARTAVVLVLALSGGTVAAEPFGGPPQAAPPRGPRPMRHEAQAAQQSLAEAVRRVERATGGQILGAERVPFEGRNMNRIKVVDATGRVRVITDDPDLGRPTHDDDGGND